MFNVDRSNFPQYDHLKIQKKLIKKWDDDDVFKFKKKSKQPKSYVLEMLPYPSGNLHMGHVRNYTIGDIIARYKRFKGFNVFHPMGWDAFGLPAENAAIESGKSPQEWTYKNIETMKDQQKMMGLSYDWSTELATCDPEYYKHEQAMFLEMKKFGLVYQKNGIVNWDPVDNTVLANEQVIDGKGWRSGAPVVQKNLKQWFFKISKYSEELLSSLDTLTQWPETVKTLQRNWIGKSIGCSIDFSINKLEGDKSILNEITKNNINNINIFSTKPETVFGCSFIAISHDHLISKSIIKLDSEVSAKIKNISSSVANSLRNEKEKVGVFTGIYCSNPANDKIIPVYVANFVLSEYGSGAVFGCPGHDERDFDFAKKYNLDITHVIEPKNGGPLNQKNFIETDDGTMKNSGFLNGLSALEAKNKIIEYFLEKGFGSKKIQYRLRDWGISRQRYWGCPIPIIHCAKCGVVDEELKNLPVLLPTDVSISGKGNVLDTHPTWKHATCPKCKNKAVRETDTMDTFVESSWYFLRYINSKNQDVPFVKEDAEDLMPVDHYIGGIEHAVMHLLYARFFIKALRDIGKLKIDEPFNSLTTQAMVCHRAFKNKKGLWVEALKAEKSNDGKWVNKDNEEELFDQGIIKMSKSKKNVVNPVDIFRQYGSDAARMFVVSDTPIEKDIIWNQEGISATKKQLERFWSICHATATKKNELEISDSEFRLSIEKFLNGQFEFSELCECHDLLNSIQKNISSFSFNVAIAKFFSLLNILEKISKNAQGNLKDVVLVSAYMCYFLCISMNPVIPFLTEELFALFDSESIHSKSLTTFPESNNCSIAIPVQINGKTRCTINVNKNANKDEVISAAKSNQIVNKYLNDKKIIKAIFVPKKIINFVIKN